MAALCVRTSGQNAQSGEEQKLDQKLGEDKLAIAGLYGLVPVPDAFDRDHLDKLLQHTTQPKPPIKLYDPPTTNPRQQKKHSSHSSSQGAEEEQQSISEPAHCEDLFASLQLQAPADPSHDDVKHGPKQEQTDQQKQLSKQIASAKHELLLNSPAKVLKSWLDELMQKRGHALVTAPFFCALISGNKERYELAAIDIEKFATVKGMETWLWYAMHAASGCMASPIPVTEIGFATGLESKLLKAYKVLQTLHTEHEATSVQKVSGTETQQYGGKRTSCINKAVAANANDPSRRLVEVPTAIDAYNQCMKELDGKLMIAYNRNGFDERALLKIYLIAKACLEKSQQDPPKAVWQAAKQLLDNPEHVPPFLPIYPVVKQLFKVLWEMLKKEDAYAALMQDAEAAGLKALSASLDQVYQVYLAGHTAIVQVHACVPSVTVLCLFMNKLSTDLLVSLASGCNLGVYALTMVCVHVLFQDMTQLCQCLNYVLHRMQVLLMYSVNFCNCSAGCADSMMQAVFRS